MSKKPIFGIYVGTQAPRANLGQTNPNKADYVVGRPSEKTEAMTQPVGIDDNGNLWTFPGGAGDTSALEARLQYIENKMSDFMYEEIAITSFQNSVVLAEYGATITDVNLVWSINKTPTMLTLDGSSIDVDKTSQGFRNLSITKDTNRPWTLVATDERGVRSERSTSIAFHNGVYYGVKADPETYDSAFVLGLTKELRSNKKPSVIINAGEDEHIYYCLPTRMGTCSFVVGGFTGGFSLVDTIEFTNAFGFTESYYIYRSDATNLGVTNVTII